MSNQLFAQVTFTSRFVTQNLDAVKKFQIVDLDDDGDLDVVASSSDSTGLQTIHLAWFENNGQMSFTQHIISESFPRARVVAVGNLNNDNFPDIVAGSNGDEGIFWFANDGSSPPVWSPNDLSVGALDSTYDVSLADIDGDDDMDILAVFYHGDSLGIFENDGFGVFTFTKINSGINGPLNIDAGYIDDDSDLDLVAAGYTITGISVTSSGLSWWSGNGDVTFGSEESISTIFDGPNGIRLGDIDMDGDTDIVAAGWGSTGKIGWWENDGTGTFSSVNIIENEFPFGRTVDIVDVDTDGDNDVLAVSDGGLSLNNGSVMWYENDGSEIFTPHILTSMFNYGYFIRGTDFDGDGDMDIISSAEFADDIAWWENQSEEVIATSGGNDEPISFYSGQVDIDYNSGNAGDTRVFYSLYPNQNGSSLGSGIDHISSAGFFTILTDKASAGGSVTFDFSLVSEWSNYDTPTQLVICQWDNSTSQWIEAGSSQSVVGDTEIVVSGITQNDFISFSKWTLGSRTTDNPLPVSLVSFTARALSNSIRLSWQTASEVNNLGFELWRKSDGDSIFSVISSYLTHDELLGQGSVSFGSEYSFNDENVEYGQTYHYQLTDISYSGTRTDHPPISIKYVTEGLVRIADEGIPAHLNLQQNFPNPFNGSTYVRFSVPQNNPGQAVQLMVFNELGQRVKTLFDNALTAGQYQVSWDGTNENGQPVSSGMYIYVLKNGLNHIFKRMLFVK